MWSITTFLALLKVSFTASVFCLHIARQVFDVLFWVFLLSGTWLMAVLAGQCYGKCRVYGCYSRGR